MSGLLRFFQVVFVVGALVGGGLTLWRNRDKVKQTWESLGGVSGFQGSAGMLMESVGPVAGFVRQMAALKK